MDVHKFPPPPATSASLLFFQGLSWGRREGDCIALGDSNSHEEICQLGSKWRVLLISAYLCGDRTECTPRRSCKNILLTEFLDDSLS